MIEFFSSHSLLEILKISFLIYLNSLVFSYLIADGYIGPDPDYLRWLDSEDTFKLVKSPHQIKVIKLTFKISPFLFVVIYSIFFIFKLY